MVYDELQVSGKQNLFGLVLLLVIVAVAILLRDVVLPMLAG